MPNMAHFETLVEPDRQLLTKKQTARYLGISIKTLDRLERQSQGPGRFRVGMQVRYSLDRILRWLEQQNENDGGHAA